LRGMIDLPRGAPGFYSPCTFGPRPTGKGPGRGTIDPEKEQAGYELALSNFNTTYTDNAREQGLRFKRLIKRRQKEQALLAGLRPETAPQAEREAA
jgi:capsid protein